ncbi:MAG: ROK family protein [Muribaculaceae bacterium]|nr:ROK family protein [Muribaculaceae bacterium]MDD6942709.1 ROK family protein [Bacteroidales bacterium]MDY2733845.1 ROK family protein [Muribaculaceae bacterium]MDY4649325.1 ROK family protein [Muribaculaceae bacterium]
MSKPYVVGIDIGGTNTVFGIVDARGHVVAADSVKTKKHVDFDDYINDLHEGLSRLIKANDAEDQIQGIGIGAPNANYYTGEIINPPNLPWGPIIPLAEKVSKSFGGIPVAITNDANAAAVGEMTYGAARGMKDFIMITLGTGVGSGIVINGQLVYGSDGFAGELGHVIMKRNNGRVCGCGRTGCLEAYCSATGVARTAREFLEIRNEPSLLRNLDIEEITSKDVYDAAMAGDRLAKDIFTFTGTILGEAFADMVAFSSPQAIVLFGGLAKSGELLLKPLKETFEKSVMPVFAGKTKILISELKESDAAVLGASALGWEARYRYEAPRAEKVDEVAE